MRKKAASIRTSWESQLNLSSAQNADSLTGSRFPLSPPLKKATHVSLFLLRYGRDKLEWGNAGKRNLSFLQRGGNPPSLLTTTTFFPSSSDLCSLLETQVSHTKRDAACSRAALALRGNLKVDRSGITLHLMQGIRPTRYLTECLGDYYARLRSFLEGTFEQYALPLHLRLFQHIYTQKSYSFFVLIPRNTPRIIV